MPVRQPPVWEVPRVFLSLLVWVCMVEIESSLSVTSGFVMFVVNKQGWKFEFGWGQPV